MGIRDYFAAVSTVLQSPEIDLVETNHHAFNRAVWDRLSEDPVLAALDYRIETDRHGQIIMSPLPAPSHGSKQGEIAYLLRSQSKSGKVVTECPISTAEGVKGADVAWCSDEIWQRLKGASCFTECPELVVEVVSPANTKREIEEKKALYLNAGAQEVWICGVDGNLRFWNAHGEVQASRLYPQFPVQIDRPA